MSRDAESIGMKWVDGIGHFLILVSLPYGFRFAGGGKIYPVLRRFLACGVVQDEERTREFDVNGFDMKGTSHV